MRVSLNLATRPYADQGPALKQLRIGMAILTVVLIGLGLGLLHFHQDALRMAAQEAVLDKSIARIRQEEVGYEAQMQQPANSKVLTQAQFLNQLFDEKSFSWTAAMEDLEQVLPGGVQVTAIEPNRGKDGRLTLHLRVSGPRERSVEMVRNMEHSLRFASPRISGENADNSSQGDLQLVRAVSKVSFDVLAEYNPATLEERNAEIGKRKRSQPIAKTLTTPIRAPRPRLVPPNQMKMTPQMPAGHGQLQQGSPQRLPTNTAPQSAPNGRPSLVSESSGPLAAHAICTCRWLRCRTRP